MPDRGFFISLLVFCVVCFFGLRFFVDHEVEKGIDQAVSETPGLTLAYGDIDVSIMNRTVKLVDVRATLPNGRQFTAREALVTRFDRFNTIPYYMTAHAKGVALAVTPENFGPMAAPLIRAGVETVVCDVDLDYDYNAEAEALTLHSLAVRADNLCDLALSGSVDRLDLYRFRMEELIGLRIVQADLKVVNRSVVDTLITSASRKLGVTLDEARSWIAAELTSMAAYASRVENTVAQDVFRGLAQFVNDPGQLDLGVRPDEPTPLLFFFMGRDMYDILRLLNVTATTDSSSQI